LDTKGKITVGVGTNIDNCDDFVKVNFTQKKNSVSDAQKNYVCNQLRQASQRLSGRWNIDAEEYKKATDLRIDDEEAQRLAQQHLTNDVAHLRSEFSDFDNFPMPLKEVLVDLQYNTGNLTEKKWPKLYEAIRNRDVEGIAKNVHRKDVGKERNDWAENLVRSIRF
jgi:GH24 family phage-related lysozyme (muramidase)